MTSFHRTGVSLLAFLFLSVGSARADVTYTYTGNNFSTSATSPYSTSDHLSGVLDFAEALGPNLGYQRVAPVSFSFTGSVVGDSVTNTANITDSGFFVRTNAAGVIDGWYIGISSPGNFFVQSQHTLYDGVQFDYFGKAGGHGSVLANAGQWAVTVSAVPEPETYAMLLAGLGLMGFMSRRKSGKKEA
ncbi:PEP-CTERM sorting domain-containing protein [Actimicrobium sp. CCI2.3]|nr:PEP-CTERM sorting domain-containing protein [Actimicrobium sp. CCI2.3]MEB0023222.1 PEP-CTERM sorting domain-containing protein [Actimicrobium sp. CCI2.3]